MPRGIMVGGLLLILGLFLVAPSLLKNVRVIKAMPDGHWLYAISATLLAFALFIANPISFYAHSTDFSSELFYRIAGELLVYFVIAVISFVSLYVLLDSPVRKCLTFLCVFGALDAITYSAIGVKHIGLMTYFHLPFISLLDRTRLEVVVEMAILLAFMGVTTYLTARYRENITRVMSAMLVASLCVAAADAYQGSTKVVRIQRGGLGMPSNHQDIIGFSRERNVLIIMLDGFPGGTIQTILNKDPGTLEDYEGFVWYPNMLTTHAGTLGSIATLTGGHKYTVQQINQGHYGTIGNAIREAYRTYPDAFIPKGFQVSYVKPYFNNGCESIDKRVLCTDTSPYGPYYHDREEPDALLLQDTHSHLPAVLSMTSVFKAAPFFLKGWVYDHGSWRGAISPTLRARRMNSYKVPDWGFLYVLAHESNADRPVKTFKFIHLEIPHNPYVLGATCRLLPPQASIDQALHVNIETESVCALRQIGVLLSWMKKNGIYDVTKIVLVSDHGLWSDNPMFPPGFSKTVPSGNHNQAEPGWLQSLLLVKDFDAKGKLSRSDTFLSQPDVPSIVCAAVGGCSDVGPDPTTHDLGDRVLTFVNTTWDLSKDEGNSHFTIMEGYEVRDNIFDPKNWKRFK
jgi:hypothetical protein